jgi:hypothetical protein
MAGYVSVVINVENVFFCFCAYIALCAVVVSANGCIHVEYVLFYVFR